MSVKSETPKELSNLALQLVQECKTGGKLRKGTNEVTKSVERNESKFVVIASDVNPPEIIQHIPMLCEEKKIPFAFVPSKAELGAAAGLPVGTSAIGIVNAGESGKKLQQIAEQLKVLAGAEVKEIKKEEPKAEAPKAEETARKKTSAGPTASEPKEEKEKKAKAPRKPKEKKEEPKPVEAQPLQSSQ